MTPDKLAGLLPVTAAYLVWLFFAWMTASGRGGTPSHRSIQKAFEKRNPGLLRKTVALIGAVGTAVYVAALLELLR